MSGHRLVMAHKRASRSAPSGHSRSSSAMASARFSTVISAIPAISALGTPPQARVRGPPARSPARPGLSDYDLLQPAGFHEAVDQRLCSIRIEALAQRVPANILAGYLPLAMRFDPPQRLARVHVTVAEADQP